MLEKVVSQETLFEGRIITVNRDVVSLHNGQETTREVVKHEPAVAILAVDGDRLLLIKQFRYPVGEILVEVPAGIMESTEDPLVSAKRELREEIGVTASTWTSLGGMYTAPGFTDEYLYLFLAEGLTYGETDLDEDEAIELYPLAISEIDHAIASGEVKDAKTLACLLIYRDRLRAGQ